MYDSTNLCRLCAEIKKDCITLSTCDTQNIQLWNKLQYIAPEIIEENDEFPSEICMICSSQLNIVYEYKRNFLQAYDKLKQLRLKTSLCEDVKEEIEPLENIKIEDSDLSEFCQVDIKHETNTLVNYQPETDKYNCLTCGKLFTKKNYLNDHIKWHNKDNFKQECAVCAKKFLYKRDLVRHMTTHKNLVENDTDKHICNICFKSFHSANYLQVHLVRHDKDKLKHKCVQCSKRFLFKYMLKKHMSNAHCSIPEQKSGGIDERQYVCETCGKEFRKPNNLWMHKKIHTNLFSYQCERCGKGFRFSGDLKLHIMSHLDDRPFACDLCASKFRQASKLMHHKRVVHEGLRPYKCNLCEKTYTQSSILKQHLRTHTNERPYKCRLCDRTFTYKAHLTRHFRIHTDERPHQCTICNKGFTQKFNLKVHLRVHKK